MTRAFRAGALGPFGALGPLVALALAACGGDAGSDTDAGAAAAGETRLEYSAITLEGDSVGLAALRGEPVLLNVWATWCAPCRQEIPVLQALHERHHERGLHLVGVTVDSRHAGDDIRSFVRDFGITYDVWWDPDQSIVDALAAAGVPVTVLVGREGRVVWRHLGVIRPDHPELDEAIEAALGAGAHTGAHTGAGADAGAA